MKNYRLAFREIDRDKFNEIAEGRKTIETRAATVKYQRYGKATRLRLYVATIVLLKVVTKVEHFTSLDQMFVSLPLSNISPNAKDESEARSIYYEFPGHKEKIEAEGILAFTLES